MDQMRLMLKSSDALEEESHASLDFSPSRLTLARKRRGLTKTELAAIVDIDVRSVSAYEAGQYAPSETTIVSLAGVLKFPVAFFFGEPLDEPRPDTASFRAQSKMSATQRDMALSQGALALHLNRWLENKFELPEACIPELNREKTPEAAAEALRREWGLGNVPVRNMVHLLESKGVRVFSLSVKALEVDAFSMWQGDTPLMFLNMQKTAEHSRFDSAHELGHLVLDRHAACQGRESERRADAFASAFLMPRSSVLAHVPRFPTVDQLIKLKKIWCVSVAALAYRYHTLGVLTDWHYRSIYIDLAKRGYSRSEPQPVEHETSQLVAKAFDALRKEEIHRQNVAKELQLPLSELDDLLLGLTFGRHEGGKKESEVKVPDRASLIRVK
jgi:Zn-dependent peptidase ImmA (M78 family)/transcriptional regulator with XRE-family HTH domain